MARWAVPGIIAGLATTGLLAASTGATTTTQGGSSAGPSTAASATPSAPNAAIREQGTSRSGSDRPELTPAAVAKAEAAAQRKALAVSKAKAAAKARAAAKAKAAAKARAAAKAKAAAKAGSLPKVDLPSLKVVDTEYTRVNLNVRERPDADSDLITVLDSGSKVSVTATVRGPWRYVAYRGDGGWVREQYLVESKPKPPAAARKSSSASPRAAGSGSSGSGSSRSGGGISGAACSAGSKVESGLTPDAIRVHRAICARFPGVTSYGGVRADSLPEHPSGRALDAMVSSQGLGQQVADWVRANAKQLGVSEVIFAQRIWTVQRGSEGWRGMSDRGSASANHHDHVHVSVYGSAGR